MESGLCVREYLVIIRNGLKCGSDDNRCTFKDMWQLQYYLRLSKIAERCRKVKDRRRRRDMHYSQISAIHTTVVTFNCYSPQVMLHCKIIPHSHEKLHEGIYLRETMWKPNLIVLRAIGGCKLNKLTVRHLYMFTAHLYLSLSASLLFEAAWIELQPEMISILLNHCDYSSMDPDLHQ